MSSPTPLVAVTDHAAGAPPGEAGWSGFRQRVGGRSGDVDPRVEIVTRVVRAWEAGRVTGDPPPGARAARGSLYVRDLVDRSLVFVCRRETRPAHPGELVVVTLWEQEGGPAPPRVPRRFTDALRDQ